MTDRLPTSVQAARRRCTRCGCRLALDNVGTTCWPCDRAVAEEGLVHAPVLQALRHLDPGAAQAAWRSGGVPRLAELLDTDRHTALDVGVALGLTPAHLTRRASLCHDLIDLDHLGSVATAARLGISRWTVASWRTALGLGSED